jgi:pyridoxamine 5'-phosphate oxidase
MRLSDLRLEYRGERMQRADLDPDPILQFEAWLDEAVRAGLREPNACALATASEEGRPSARMVLLKEVGPRGFVFATNYHSRKSLEIEARPWVALVFYWNPLERQVRIEGRAGRTSPDESDAIFASRPRGARIGAWASPQSQEIPDRETLERRLADAERRFAGREPLPRPEHWGGFRVAPERIEFWQGRPHRLHDRLCYERDERGWRVGRLAP